MLASGVTLLFGVGAAVNFMHARSEKPVSDLTLANIEAMGFMDGDPDLRPLNQGPAVITQCPSGCTSPYGKYCAGEKDGGGCVDIPCLWANGGGDIWGI